MCKTAADCGTGGSCIDNGENAVCEYPVDKNTPCEKETDCPAPLACASDYRCRNLCMTADDCNVLGIKGRVCAKDANGVLYCADPPEVTNGTITAPPPPGHSSSPVMEPPDATVMGLPDATVVGPGADGSPGGGSEAATGDSATGGPDASMDALAPTCAPPCTQAKTCIEGASGPTCVPCGSAAGQVCCDGQMCGVNLTCTAQGSCQCGYANQACCGGNTCNSGLSCNGNDAGGPPTCACGEIGTRCCPGVDGGTSSCSGGAVCAGSKCTCIVDFASAGSGSSPGVVLRTDGTVWASIGTTSAAVFTEMDNGSGPLRATSIAASEGYESSVPPIGCAVVSGGVWCFPTGGTLTDSTDLGAGLGPTDTTSSPVQVLTPVSGGTPLSNVTQVVGGLPVNGANFCAVTSDGSAWCWGYGQNGQLGNGGTANSSLASQVMANASTPFTNVAEVRMGYDASCARRTDGSVWCWGNNQYDELGVPVNMTPQSYYPVQVPFSGTSAQRTATGLGAGRSETFCAIMQDTSVVCWGYNNNGQAGAISSAGNVGPTSVLVAAGGAPLTGIVDITGDGPYSMCAKTGNLAILCWGAYASGPYPVAYQNTSNTAAVGIVAPLTESQSGVGYIDPSGLLFAAGSSSGPVPPCTNP